MTVYTLIGTYEGCMYHLNAERQIYLSHVESIRVIILEVIPGSCYRMTPAAGLNVFTSNFLLFCPRHLIYLFVFGHRNTDNAISCSQNIFPAVSLNLIHTYESKTVSISHRQLWEIFSYTHSASCMSPALLCPLHGRVYMVACVQVSVCTCVNCPVSRYGKHAKWVQIPAVWTRASCCRWLPVQFFFYCAPRFSPLWTFQ